MKRKAPKIKKPTDLELAMKIEEAVVALIKAIEAGHAAGLTIEHRGIGPFTISRRVRVLQ